MEATGYIPSPWGLHPHPGALAESLLGGDLHPSLERGQAGPRLASILHKAASAGNKLLRGSWYPGWAFSLVSTGIQSTGTAEAHTEAGWPSVGRERCAGTRCYYRPAPTTPRASTKSACLYHVKLTLCRDNRVSRSLSYEGVAPCSEGSSPLGCSW